MNEIYDRIQKPIFIVENGMGAIDQADEMDMLKMIIVLITYKNIYQLWLMRLMKMVLNV